jgi:hypothetical protein
MNYKPGVNDAAVLPVISAAVAAFLDHEKSESRLVRRRSVTAGGSIWSLRGRLVLMERRQQLSVRRTKKNESF